MKYKITHLYPKHMSLYGDRGNIIVLVQRAQEAGIELDVQDCVAGERIEPSTKLIMLGGGQDHDQEKILNDLLSRENEIKDLIANGAIFLGICGGYQLLGEYYESAVGSYLNGLKILNLQTNKGGNSEKRIIGNVIAESPIFGKLIGFENHGGRTFLGEGLQPLAQILQGGGNNGSDKTEGVLASFGKGKVLGTYFHGFLAKNPQVADYLIQSIASKSENYFANNDPLESLNHNRSLKLKY